MKRNKRILAIQAAITFFQKKHDDDVKEIYQETLEDMYNEYTEHRTPLFGRNAVMDLITNDALPKEQKEKWDNLVISFWIYENHRILISPYTKYDDLLDELRNLHGITHRQELTMNQMIVALFASSVIPPTLPLVVPTHQILFPIHQRATTPSTRSTSVEHA